MRDGVLVVYQHGDLMVRQIGGAGVLFRPLALIQYHLDINTAGFGIRQGLCNSWAGEAICLNEDLLLGLMYGVSHKLGSAAIG